MLSESLLSRDAYILEILHREQPPTDMLCPMCQSKQGLLRCNDCFSRRVLCQDCCLVVHQESPFHHIEKWTGSFFQATSLSEEGFTLRLCHNGVLCPVTQPDTTTQGTNAETQGAEAGTQGIKAGAQGTQQADNKKSLVVVDVSGVHQLQISWCRCKDAPAADIQLLRNDLFPASISNPSTAFTFRLLNHFYIDSVECKTSAMSFFSKLRRLTNDSDPDSVPVCLLAFHILTTSLIHIHRTAIGN